MRIDQVKLQDIHFDKKEYGDVLQASLLRIGLNFPIRIRRSTQGYICCDGHKRLSAVADILETDPQNRHFQTIRVIIEEDARTSPPWSMHNHH